MPAESRRARGGHKKGASNNLDAPIFKNKLPGHLPLSDRAFAFLVTPKLLFAQEK